MKKLESFIIGCFLGAIPILFCLVVVICIWWFAELLTDQTGPWLALAALVIGGIIDIVFLKRWVQKAYQLSFKILAAVYLFYSVGVLGFCMGVPILNFGLGILAGFYIVWRAGYVNANLQQRSRLVRKTAVFTAIVMLLMCCLTGFWALIGGMVGTRFESPVLSFTFTIPILVAIVLTGGLFLAVVQYILTRTAAKVITPKYV